eukprot:IDg8425t1
MSESDIDTESMSTIKIPRFHGRRGDYYGLWRLRLRAICRVKGLWSVVEAGSFHPFEASTTSSAQDAPSSVGAPIIAKNTAKLEKASGIIISALGDAPLRVVIDADDNPARMLKLLDARYASNRTVSRIAVQTQLFRMQYTDQNMASYVDTYASLFSQLERMGKGAAIPDSHKAPMLLASINPDCVLESTAAALRTKDATELTWDYVATTLIDEYNARRITITDSRRRGRNQNRRSSKVKSELVNPSTSQGGDHLEPSSEIETTARALAAALKDGHTEKRCHLNPDNPDNRLPQKVLDRIRVKVSNKTSEDSKKQGKLEIVGATVEKASISPPNDRRSYADSGATVHCFYNEFAFIAGSLKPCTPRTIMLADATPVVANKSGDVLVPLQNANIRLKEALYVPSLGFNLISVGRLSDNGIESHFRRHDMQLSLECSGFMLGTGQRDSKNGLYMLPEPDLSVECTLSLTERKDLELWHRRLAHINSRDLSLLHEHVDGVPVLH